MPQVLLYNAIYSWWVHPLAVNDTVGGDDVTWVGSIAKAGTNRVHRIRWPETVDVVPLGGQDTADDHNGAALALNPDQDDLLVLYSRHGGDPWVRYRTVHRTTMAVSAEQRLDFDGSGVTYAQVLQHGDTLHVLCRQGNDRWCYRTSPDWGATWGPVKVLVDGTGYGQQYVVARHSRETPTVVHLAHYGHPVNSPWRNVGYARIDVATGAITHADGDPLGNLSEEDGPGITPPEFEAAIVPSGDYRARLLDISSINGRPFIAYAVWLGLEGVATYKVKSRSPAGVWTTADWEMPAGPPFGFNLATHYVGGVAIGRQGRMYSSRKQGSTWIVERWQWNGAGYDLHSEIDRSTTRLVRPYAVMGDGDGELVYQRVSHYDGFTDYDSDLIVRTG